MINSHRNGKYAGANMLVEDYAGPKQNNSRDVIARKLTTNTVTASLIITKESDDTAFSFRGHERAKSRGLDSIDEVYKREKS